MPASGEHGKESTLSAIVPLSTLYSPLLPLARHDDEEPRDLLDRRYSGEGAGGGSSLN